MPAQAHRSRISPLSLVLWAVLPAALTMFILIRGGGGGGGVHFAGDFHYAFWPAAARVLHGLSPYVDPGARSVTHATAFVYPALAALALAPLALLPHAVADEGFAILQIAATLLTLRVLDIRDWRLYGLVMLCPAVFAGWSVANVTLLLGLGIACCWRWRSRAPISGLLLAVLVSFKLFLWPLILWPLAMRRYTTLAYAAVCGVALNIVAWAALGFDQIGRYAHLLHALAAVEERRGYSVIALAHGIGVPGATAWALSIGASAAGALACLVLGRRGLEVQVLALAIGVSLSATPIVQMHYFALLIVPLALVRPRLSLAWSLPLLMWVAAARAAQPWQMATALALAGGTLAVICLPTRAPREWRPALGRARPGARADSLDLRLAPPSASSVVSGKGAR